MVSPFVHLFLFQHLFMNFVSKGRVRSVVGTSEVVILIRKKEMEIVVKEEITCTEER